MLSSVVRFFYPNIEPSEVKKFSLFGMACFFTLGTYWILRLLKDLLIYQLSFPVELGWANNYGTEFIPTMKLISWGTIFLAVFVYSRLVDKYKKQQLFYVIGAFYIAIFVLLGVVLFLNHTHGVHAFSWFTFAPWLPMAAAGVIGYLATESFGSLMIALFWSFTISVMTGDEAKRAFPFIIALTQIGTITASLMVKFQLPGWALLAICTGSICAVFFFIGRIVKILTPEQLEDRGEKKAKPDVLAGLKLLATKPYLMGVFVVSTFYEIAKTIVDYQMKSQARFLPGVNFQDFIGTYGVWTNSLALLMALFGTSVIMKRMGLRFCLILYPAMFGAAMTGLYFFYLSGPNPGTLLDATFYVMMLVTATSYAVNNPTKEMMYIPTSKDAKFKTKGFIDMAGNRSAKGAGAVINTNLVVPKNYAASLQNLMLYGSLIGLGIIGLWIMAAIYVGKKNTQLVKDGEIIE